MSFELDRSSKKESTSIEEATSSTLSAIDNRPAQRRKYSMQQAARQSSAAKTSLQRQVSAASSALGNDTSKANKTGLPDGLKSGIEQLSGYDMSDVKVHANSSKPKEVGAHAYAQGTDIHLASGQEQHLPHEAWHAVQQKQGRVQPTTEVNGVAVNDNTSLESEADIMGSKALQMKATDSSEAMVKKPLDNGSIQPKVITQRVEDKEEAKFGGIVKQTLFVLEGSSSWVGWLTNSTFTQLKGKVKEYEAASLGQRALLLNDIYELGTKWYEKHKILETGKDKNGKPATENDLKRLVSVRDIVKAIREKRQKREDKAAESKNNKPTSDGTPSTAIKEVTESEDLQIARSEDKVGLIAKAKALLTGKESTFMKIDRLFSDYKEYHNMLLPNTLSFDESAISNLKAMVGIADNLKVELLTWREKHHRIELPKSEETADESINKTIGDYLFYAATRPLTLLPERFGAIESFTNWWNKDFDAKFNFIQMVEANFGYLNLNLAVDPKKNVHFVANGIALDGLFSNKHSNGSVEVELPNNVGKASGVGFVFTDAGIAFEQSIELKNITNIEGYKDSLGFNITKATLSKNLDHLHINSGLNIDTNVLNYVEKATLTGNTTSSYAFEVGKWTSPTGTFGFTADIKGGEKIWSNNFSVKNGVGEINTASNSFKVFTKDLSFQDLIPKMTLDKDGFQWSETPLVHKEDTLVTKFLELAKISFSSSGFSTKYTRKVTASDIKFDTEIGKITAAVSEGSITIANNAVEKNWSIDKIKLDLDFIYKNYFKLDAKGIDYSGSTEQLNIAETTITLLDGLPGQLAGSTAKIEELLVSKDEIDWKLITLNNPTENSYSPFGDLVTVKAPDTLKVEGKKTDYKTTLAGTNASINTSYFNAHGSADFSVSASSTTPAIERARLKFAASSPTIPPPIPGIWPINLSYPIPVGPFPFEVTAGFKASGGFDGSMFGSIKYDKSKGRLNINGKANLNGKLGVGAELGLNAGSSYVLSAGVYGGAYTTISASLNGGIDGSMAEKNGELTLDTLTANYGMTANANFDLKVGARVTALYFFQKTLYETKIASWDLEEVTRKGKYDFLMSDKDKNKDKVKLSNSSKLFGGNQALPDYKNKSNALKTGEGLEASSKDKSGYSEIDVAKKAIQQLLNADKKILSKEDILNSQSELMVAVSSLTKKAKEKDRGWITKNLGWYKDTQAIVDKSYLIIEKLNLKIGELKNFISSGNVKEIQEIDKNILFANELLTVKPTKEALETLIRKYEP